MALVAVGGQCMCALMSVCVCVCVYLPGSGGLGLDCNDNGEEFKWEKKRDQGRLQGGWKRLWHHCYSFSLSFCLSISLLQILHSVSLTLGFYISHKKLHFFSWFYPYLHYLPVCPSELLKYLSLWICSQKSQVSHIMPGWKVPRKIPTPRPFSSICSVFNLLVICSEFILTNLSPSWILYANYLVDNYWFTSNVTWRLSSAVSQ